jgi:hypothetical protein
LFLISWSGVTALIAEKRLMVSGIKIIYKKQVRTLNMLS